ncbi:glycosyltransferase family 2 protein [Desulfosporosinus sp. BG]|uniref:glycosyltransferase family 2 protein n=1 Tax=Desulfosporosinus sp. BG TaxID=1633135 RepID=UPI00083A28AD|nr:glycosyltransferase family 2 protein [Desulfosporosinus sp. BG]ODA40784.1 Glycosyltransferase [Desulfosporosinus sp. BG]
MREKYLLSIVIPMYCEEEVAEECYQRITKVMKDNGYCYELLFINDGSKDNTINILRALATRDEKVKVVNFSRNFGHQTAVTCGIDLALGDAIVLIDADLQDPPEQIKNMVDLWHQGYDVVYGKRKKRNGETIFKRFTAKCFYRVLAYMSDVDIPINTGDFRLIDKRVATAFSAMPERNRFVRGMIAWLGYNQTHIEYERDERFAGKTKYPLKKMLKFAGDGIISFSSKPLKLMSTIGFLTIILAFIILIYSIVQKISGGSTSSGWASLMVAITFFSGVQLFSIGILGEYIARIYDESKNRPLYIIKDKYNFMIE